MDRTTFRIFDSRATQLEGIIPLQSMHGLPLWDTRTPRAALQLS